MGTCQEIVAAAWSSAFANITNFVLTPALAKTLVVGQEHTFTFANSVTPEITTVVKEVIETVKSGDLHHVSSVAIKALAYSWTVSSPVIRSSARCCSCNVPSCSCWKTQPSWWRTVLSCILFIAPIGITEPLEFMFVFLAPALYAIMPAFTGLSLVVTICLVLCTVSVFSAGLIDFVLNQFSN